MLFPSRQWPHKHILRLATEHGGGWRVGGGCLQEAGVRTRPVAHPRHDAVPRTHSGIQGKVASMLNCRLLRIKISRHNYISIFSVESTLLHAQITLYHYELLQNNGGGSIIMYYNFNNGYNS